ncbi:MAG: ABC transporter ATP-binding protein [Betaproteobacteria bacterium]|jgi:peptide/nickel transport system ATP-binding protein|nr:ABC transporter ATP-binding protein [Betaproteobacteria bacterium]MBP6464515.1 ABC transporter ATP-binding protein [Rubrivivax sp.]MBK7275867.1 ABC transporter ATP-binding protein [Betaproteobacteria bacterium]MBK7516786.1 ABC transporter ATP-binding protein [Betaproteobacteria bacterium]MBK8108309.1 ABC transporter ATP-binding protein [Betaproteobacteria bacterium]
MLLSIQDLRVAFRMGKGVRAEAVKGVSFDIPENTTVALVGESGSGKSVTAMSVLNLLPDNAERQGRILWQGRDLLQAALPELQALRGKEIACVFQDPMSSLNPVFSVGQQLAEPLMKHLGLSRRQALARAEELLGEVGIPEPKRRLESYPHEMSGGQQQRVMIAMALSCEPRLLIADEPTTALDVTIQRQILELLGKLKTQHRMSVLFISHDLGLVGEIADQVVVMRNGIIREQGPVARIFEAPQDDYTRALLACRPSLEGNPARLMVIDDHIAAASRRAAGQAEAEARDAQAKDPAAPVVLEVRSLAKSFWLKQGLFGKREFKAVQGVNFQLRKGHTLGVVGESGSGKTTMGLTLLRLHEPTGGEVIFDGQNLLKLGDRERQLMRRRIQIVFQNPYASLNPRFTIGQTLLEPMVIHGIGTDTADREQRARSLLEKVGLDGRAFGKYPHEFSGGQRQRVAIARCLTLNPEVLVLDEAVSALDVSVQAQVLNLLRDLQDEFGLAYVFISHDLAVVRFISDEVLVMKDGVVVEQASAAQILAAPREDYTKRLLAAIPRGYRAAA